jgi:unsaturated rhamnogalacturonyl hydrolase
MPTAEDIARRVARRTVELGYREWNWGEGVAQYALIEASTKLGEPLFLKEVEGFASRNAALRPERLEQVMPAIAALRLYESTGAQVGLDLSLRVAAMLETHPRSHHGAFTVTPVRSVWVDYIYETAPFLCHLARITGDRKFEEWAIDQTLAYLMSCWNARESLVHHVYYDDVAAPNPFIWGRANGWTALGLVEMLELLPEEYGLRPFLSRFLRHLSARLSTLQHSSGHWHTVLLDPRTELEPATTAMISLALSKAVRGGWIDPSYQRSADLAWGAVVASVDEHGDVTHVSAETPPGDADDYQATPTGVYPWGQGFALLAALDRYEHDER